MTASPALSDGTPRVVSLGCRLNIAESETIRALLGDREAVVVNSCAVTNAAVKETRAAIRRLRREAPGAELIVTGCAATIDPAGFLGMAEVDRVVANDAKLAPESWGSALPAPPIRFAGHARALVAVQNGCDHACTFCAIPAGRGPSRSVPAGAVVEQVAALVAAGHCEVVLTGVDLTSYGHDLPGAPTLGSLVARVLRFVPALPRLRLSSLDSVEIDPLLLDLITGEPRVAPHVHLSLQAGHDLILKRMKRRHARAEAMALVQRLKARRPNIAIGADLIAGFPTENEAQAAATLALIDDAAIVHAHIFPYSPRAGTPAARMPQVSPPLIRERAARLRARAAEAKAAWLSGLVGGVEEVLVERPGDRGRAGNFAEVRLASPIGSPSPEQPALPTAVGSLLKVRITGATATHLTGTPA
jgi:threonylcarbamoyladenosine tRNA methylthiotransferase MtaB